MELTNAYDKAKELAKLPKKYIEKVTHFRGALDIPSATHCKECYGIAKVWRLSNIARVVLAGDTESLNDYLCDDCIKELEESHE